MHSVSRLNLMSPVFFYIDHLSILNLLYILFRRFTILIIEININI